MMQKPRVQPRYVNWLGVVGSIMLVTSPTAALAQIAGDGTLGTQVNGALTAPCAGNCIITNGATRGSNLFHSFQQFSLPNGDFAGFVTTPAIQNVIVRVTGVGQPFISNINGTIATSNPANFFLLNPNGIVFGSGAALNIGGSFLATTANRMQFADGTEFRTTDPAPLLTVSLPVGLQFGQTSGEIRSGLRIGAGINSRFTDFALVGGDVTLDNSVVQAPGQRIGLVGVSENGTVGLRLNGDRLSLNLAADTPRRDISLINGSIVNAVASKGKGEVFVVGRNIFLSESAILTGILRGLDNAATNLAGDITIDAANLQLTRGSAIGNAVRLNATGQGGNISITAADIQVRDGSAIAAITAGNGNTGNLRVSANTIALDGSSGILSQVAPTGNGRSGDITIETGSLVVTDAVVSSSTAGNGNAGNLRVFASNIASSGIASGIGSEVFDTGNGHSGDITIETGSLTVTNGAVVSADTSGNGNAGSMRVIAKTIALNGLGGIGSEVKRTGRGQGGDVTVETGSLTVTNGAVISSSTRGDGDGGDVRVSANTIALDGATATSNDQTPSGIGSQVIRTGRGSGGDVTIETGSLIVTNGAKVSASTFGNGNGGNVQVSADTIVIAGTTPDGRSPSGIVSEVSGTGSGQGGDVTVKTDSLTVINGARVSASTFGNGNGGDVRVTANTIALAGNPPDGQSGSGISSEVGRTGSGQGGDITIKTDSLTVTNGATVSASTSGNGSGGNVRVTANAIALDGTTPDGQGASGIGSGVLRTGSGRGGDITLETDSLTVSNGAGVVSSALGNGSAGKLDLTAHTLRLDQGFIEAIAFSGDGANINLTIGDLLLMRNGSQISTSAGLAGAGGNGGNITITASRGFLITAPNENNDITANAFNGSGGKVTISAQGVYWFTPRSRAELAQLLGTNDPTQLDPRRLPTNDITAISQGNPNLSGTVNLNILNLDPSRGLVALSLNLTDPSQQISQSCTPGDKASASSFVSTGRGGLPLNPDEPLESRAVVTRWVSLPEEAGGAGAQREQGRQGRQGEQESGKDFNRQPSTVSSPTAIVEAQGVAMGSDGSVELVANRATGDRTNVLAASVPCQIAPGH